MNELKTNLIFMGEFTYPHGMAPTKRIEHILKTMRGFPNVTVRVLLQRQSRKDNKNLTGVHEGTPYETVMGDLLRFKMLAALPMLYYKTILALRRHFQPRDKNIIYYYGIVGLDNIVPLYYARLLGYRIIFDIVEDFDIAGSISQSFFHRVKTLLLTFFSKNIPHLASGIIVISSHLERKYSDYILRGIPLLLRPISVDMSCYQDKSFQKKSQISLFYAGSFGKKDGLPVLLDAFDMLAGKYPNINLELSGGGDHEAMSYFYKRMNKSPYKDRIKYLGYLVETEYYRILCRPNIIPCMTRIDFGFANAGFPFKLGEFLASGKPVIASLVSDIDRFLVNRHNAMVVKPGNSEEIVEATEFLLNNPEAAAIIGQRGREVAASHFDYRVLGDKLYSFLERL
jgi:glycosyltransferase involved in cell wall biosynthesis